MKLKDVKSQVRYVDYPSTSEPNSGYTFLSSEPPGVVTGSAIVIEGCLEHPIIFPRFRVSEATKVLWGGRRVCIFDFPIVVYIYEPESRLFAILEFPSVEFTILEDCISVFSPHFMSAFNTSAKVDIDLSLFHPVPGRFQGVESDGSSAALVFSDGVRIAADLCSLVRAKGAPIVLMPAADLMA